MNLAEIFRKANPSAVPPRVPVREVGQKKIQEVNQEVTEMKRSLQSNSFTNAEHLSVPIVLEYPDEIQPLNSAKKNSTNQKPEFNSYTKNWKISKTDI